MCVVGMPGLCGVYFFFRRCVEKIDFEFHARALSGAALSMDRFAQVSTSDTRVSHDRVGYSEPDDAAVLAARKNRSREESQTLAVVYDRVRRYNAHFSYRTCCHCLIRVGRGQQFRFIHRYGSDTVCIPCPADC